jgi:hypothetical protein
MKINLTKKQYLTLIRALEAGNSVYGILGDNVSDEYKERSNEIDELCNYFLDFAKDFGKKELTEKFMGELIMSEKFSEKFHEAIEDYDEENFWHELEVRLGKRDFFRSMTKEEKKEMKKNDGWFPERIHKVYENWREEFEKHGIERLEVIKKTK